MPLELMEAAVDAVRDLLRTHMPEKIADLNGRYEDEIVLDVPTEGSFFVSEQLTLENYPSIEVLGSDTPFDIDNVNTFKASHNIAVACTVMDDQDVERLRRKVYRYAVGIIEILRDQGRDAHHINFGSPAVDYSPAFRQRNSSQVLADCIVNVIYRKAEVP